AVLRYTFVDLGMSPLCESYVESHQLNEMERFYPLHVYICQDCFLAQVERYVSPEEIFTEYAYFSSYSGTLLQHAKVYTDMIVQRLGFGRHSYVVEIASNDGYLLQYFVQRGIPPLGVEPAANVAQAALARGIPTVVTFFSEAMAHKLCAEQGQADL